MYRLSIIVLSRQIACDQPWPAMAKDLCRRRKGTGEVANRDLPKYQDFRSANSSPGCGPSCNLVWKPRSDSPTTGPPFRVPTAIIQDTTGWRAFSSNDIAMLVS